MDDARLQAYVNLIKQFFACTEEEEFNNILQANQELIDPEFLQVMENYATWLEDQGNNDPANWLRNMAQQLGQNPNHQAYSTQPSNQLPQSVYVLLYNSGTDNEGIHTISNQERNTILLFESSPDATNFAQKLREQNFAVPSVETIETETIISFCQEEGYDWEFVPEGANRTLPHESVKTLERAENLTIATANSSQGYFNFLMEVLRKVVENPNPQVIYPFLTQNLDKLDENLINILNNWAKNTLSSLETETATFILASDVSNFSNLIGQFPYGNIATTKEIAITGYEIALIVFTFDAFPQDWARIQSNLASTYIDRIRGDKAENLEMAITCCQEALKVRTFDAFPQQWTGTQNNLALAYINRIKGDKAENLETAITYCQEALKVRTFAQFPEDWAKTQKNLATAYLYRIRGKRTENLEQAITAYTETLKVFCFDESSENWSDVQNYLAFAYIDRIRGDKAENLEMAIFCCQKALKVRTFDAFPQGWAQTQDHLATAYLNRITGDKAENLEMAIATYQDVLKVFTFEEFPQKWAQIQGNLGNAYFNRTRGDKAENLEMAIICHHKALKVFIFEAFPQVWAQIQGNLSSAYINRIREDRAENLEMAIACRQEALRVWTFENFPEDWAETQDNLANAYFYRIRGDKAENLEIAINLYQKALKVRTFEQLNEYWAITQRHLAIAYIHRLKGNRSENLERAITGFQEVLKVRTFENFPEDWANTQNDLGVAYSRRLEGNRTENLERAIACYQQALRVKTFEAFPRSWAMVQDNLASAYSNRLDENRAENLEWAIACYQQALTVYTFNAFPQDWAKTHNNLALTYAKSMEDKDENVKKAIASFHNALTIYTRREDPLNCLRTARNLSNLHYDEKQWQLAIKTYYIAIEALEDARIEALNPQSRQEVLSSAIDVFHHIVQAHLNLNQPDKALEYIERSKGRNLVELMTQKNLKPQGVSQTIVEEYEHLYQQVVNEQIRLQNQSINQNLSRTDNLMPNVPDYSYLEEYQQQLDTFIEQQITPIDPTFKLAQKVEPITFAEIQRLTEAATCLLQLYITSEKILAFIVSSDNKINLWQSTETDLQIFTETIDNYLQLYYSENGKQEWIKQLPNLLQNLSETLHLSEIINLIPSTCQRLIIIPHRFLHILPIHAFPISEDKVLQDKYTVQYAPSCQILQRIQQHQQHELTHLLAIQNPTKDLTFTDLEVNIIATLFTQNQIIAKDNATQNTVTTQLKNPNYHCHHFSCHGSFNPNNPLESALILAEKEPLTLSEIFELNLKKSRLVVLSACETGMIDLQSLSDEYIGLPSGFLFAGSQNVVSSLWTVNDLSTAFLMIKFYQILLDSTQQVSIAIALKTAQDWLQNLTVKEYLNQLNDCQQIVKPMQKKLTAKEKEFTRLIDMIEDEQFRIKEIESNYKLFENPFYWAAFTTSGI